MNILELCVAPALGGLELYFHRCCVELQKKGHTIVSVRLPGSRLEALGKKDGIPTRSMMRGNKFFPWRHSRQLARIIAEHRIDVVHAHHKDDLPLVALTKSTSKRPFQLAFTRQMPLTHRKKDPYHRWLYTKIDLFITITELLKRDALEKLPLPADRVQRLYYGVPSPPSKSEAFLKQFLTLSQPGDFNIGVFSRLEFQKGQHLVIEALKKLIVKEIPAKLYIVGDVMSAEYNETLLTQVKTLGLEDRVVFKGFLPQPTLAMMGMDVLVLPSRNEAFGLVVIEAMRCGITVMGVNAGGVPEIIDHNQTGLLFEWDNTDQLAGQLEHLFKDPAFKNDLALHGKEKADKEFNSDLHFQQLENLFSGLTTR
jgi:glycosyltransferase involved in cell wall biosynthesis